MSEAQLSIWGNETGADLVSSLEQQGYALVEHGISTTRLDELIGAYAIFTDTHPDPELETMNKMIMNLKNLDQLDFSKDTQSEWHKYRSNTPAYAKPNGYTNRSLQARALTLRDVVISEDPKEFFHYYPGMRELMEKRHEQFSWGSIPQELTLLLNHMHGVHFAAKTAMHGFFGKLEETQPELVRHTTPNDLNSSPLRLLFYHKGQGEMLAEGHYDRGLATLQVAESHHGLRVRDPETAEMIEIDRAPKHAIAFPALKWKEVDASSTMSSLWHDVINIDIPNTDRHLHGRNVARWSLIFFANSLNIQGHNIKSRTHNEQSLVA